MMHPHRTTSPQPRLLSERKPLRPIRVADPRKPIAETKPLSLGGHFFVAGPLVARKTR